MRFALMPYEIPEIWALSEALNWVAFRHYACGGPPDVEDLDDFEGGRTHWPDEEAVQFLTKHSRPELPEISDAPPLGPNLAAPNLDSDWQDHVNRREDQLNAVTEPAKAELFLALKRGHIGAHGWLCYTVSDRARSYQWNDNEFWEEADKKEFLQIPENQFRLDGIIWNKNFAATPNGCYRAIQVSAEELFQQFPEPAAEVFSVENRGGTLIIASDTDSKALPVVSKMVRSPRGRPPKWDWAAFHQQVATIVAKEGLPSKMAALEAKMLEWCGQAWGDEPSQSRVRDQLQPIFNAIRKNDN